MGSLLRRRIGETADQKVKETAGEKEGEGEMSVKLRTIVLMELLILVMCIAAALLMYASNTWTLTTSVVFVICAFTLVSMIFATVFRLSGDGKPPGEERERRFDEWDQRS